MTPQQLAEALGGARQDHDSWWAKCPSHADKRPSLKIDANGNAENPLVCCMSAGCTQDEVIGALKARGLWTWAEDDPNLPPGIPRQWKDKAAGATGELERLDQYRDAAGGTLGYVARYKVPGDKLIRPFFRQEAGRWKSCHADPRPLLGLNLLAKRPEAPVVLVEGEKSREAADRLLPDYVAVTWCGGTGAIRKVNWTALRGRTVTLWPDNDQAGRKAMAFVAGGLSGVGCSLSVVDVAALGLPEKGDAADLAELPEGGLPLVGTEALTEAENETEAEPGCAVEGDLTPEDFYYVCPQARYIYRRCRELWPGSSVTARVPPVPISAKKSIAASQWIASNRPVEQLTWSPGEPEIIADRYIAEGGWFANKGGRVFNLYRRPRLEHGDAGSAGRWIEHVRRIYPEDADHILRWLAHRVQRPHEKINHALVLGGAQGIGKDTLLEPVKRAVGPWNTSEVSPTVLLGRFNGYLQSVILRVSEARDLGEVNRFALYDHMKAITASPPDVLRIDRKNLQEYAVPNVVGVVITTNHRTDGLYLPADDRRHYVCWSERVKEDFGDSYWKGLWGWYDGGGFGHVAAYLAGLDLGDLDAKAPPPKTDAWHSIVDAGRSPEEGDLADALDELGRPDAVHIEQVLPRVPGEFGAWLRDRKNLRAVPHRFEEVGYVAVRNPYPKDGKWKIAGKRRVVYARHELPLREQIRAAQVLADDGPPVTEVTEVTDLASPPTTPPNYSTTPPEGQFSKGSGRARREDSGSVTSVTSVTEPPVAGGYRPIYDAKPEPGVDPDAMDLVREVFAGYILSEEPM